jgi:hypothetical protein
MINQSSELKDFLLKNNYLLIEDFIDKDRALWLYETFKENA